ncbi:CBASS cGAMP synthase [Pseudomonas alvandae]|uniref:CBASS cGAMP synthase n=1 Tax=Pseudomonas TaxID=286 RepID=UPI00389A24AB
MELLNLHSLFSSKVYQDTFINNLTLEEDASKTMLEARTDIRNTLRTELPKRLRVALEEAGRVPVPRFFTQGSWAYKTLNAPCKPPQQADLDDGTYLPFSYMESAPPSEMSSILFNTVEAILDELAEEKGWGLVTDNPNCTRLVIDSETHIDVPVYSIPDDEFLQLNEARASMEQKGLTMDSAFSIDDNWDLLPTQGVLMATKKNGWRDSDPRPVKEWVEGEVNLKGDQLRRIMRYIKAWRDNQDWEADKDPKSILLMVATAEAFDVAIHGRDDLALVKVCKELPRILRGKVINPVTAHRSAADQEDLAARLDKDGIRDLLVSRVEKLAKHLEQAINDCKDPSVACFILRAEFGSRLPNDPNRVGIESVKTAVPVATVAVKPVGDITAG